MRPPKPTRKLDTAITAAIIGACATLLAAIIPLFFVLKNASSNPPNSPTTLPTVSITSQPTFQPTSAPTASINSTDSTPSNTLTNYCLALKNGDFTTAYTYLSTRYQQQVSLEMFESVKPLLDAKGGVASCVVSNVQENGTTATADVVVTTGDGTTNAETDNLVLENGVWKIDSHT